MILSEFPLPDNATTFELYSAYRALNQPQENELDEVRDFPHWCELEGFFSIPLSQAAEAIENF